MRTSCHFGILNRTDVNSKDKCLVPNQQSQLNSHQNFFKIWQKRYNFKAKTMKNTKNQGTVGFDSRPGYKRPSLNVDFEKVFCV